MLAVNRIEWSAFFHSAQLNKPIVDPTRWRKDACVGGDYSQRANSIKKHPHRSPPSPLFGRSIRRNKQSCNIPVHGTYRVDWKVIGLKSLDRSPTNIWRRRRRNSLSLSASTVSLLYSREEKEYVTDAIRKAIIPQVTVNSERGLPACWRIQ